MLSRIARLCGRLHRRAVIGYLRLRMEAAEFDCNVIQAEMLSGPQRLIASRAYATDLSNRIADLEKQR